MWARRSFIEEKFVKMMRHEEQIRLGSTTTLDEPVSETIVSYFN